MKTRLDVTATTNCKLTLSQVVPSPRFVPTYGICWKCGAGPTRLREFDAGGIHYRVCRECTDKLTTNKSSRRKKQ